MDKEIRQPISKMAIHISLPFDIEKVSDVTSVQVI